MKASSRESYRLSKIATLDEEPRGLNCCPQAVSAWAPSAEIVACASFDAAGELARAGKVSAFVVAGAAPSLPNFLQNDAFEVATVFLFAIPALVLASTKILHGKVGDLFHHPATASLVPKSKIESDHLIPVTSNVAAAKLAVETGQACITNESCAAFFGLRVLQVLRRRRIMPFVVFVAA